MAEDIYIGTKIVAAEPMDDIDFAKSHVCNPPSVPPLDMDHSAPKPGYRVRYEDGYVSWSSKDVFERCYRKVTIQEAVMASGWMTLDALIEFEKKKEG